MNVGQMPSKHLIAAVLLVAICLGALVFYGRRAVEAPATWQLIESWTGSIEALAEWQMIETWGGTVEQTAQPLELSFETISHETYSRYENHEYLVIENSGEWEKVWLLARRSEVYPIPEVDFSSHAVIAVFMGRRSSGGYEILIEQITNAENEIIVNVKEIYPGRIYVTLTSSSPHHVIKIERVQKPIVFEVQQFKVHAWDENWNPYDGYMYELVGEHRVEIGSDPPEPSI